MKYIIILLLINLFAASQAALGADESAVNPSDFQKLTQNAAVRGTQFNLSETLNDYRPNVVSPEPQYFGYKANASKIIDSSETLSAGCGPEVKISRRRELDCAGLACFDTVAADGTRGRVWLDLKSPRKVQFPQCFQYKTWAILAVAPAQQ